MSNRDRRLRRRQVVPEGHLWLRVCRPDWRDPWDGSWAAEHGARWTPPGSWPTIYLNRDLDTARHQLDRLLEGTPVQPEDLTDDAFELVAARLPPRQRALDVVSEAGVVATGLPVSYPVDSDGRRIGHETCWPVAEIAHAARLDGVECRSAATLDGGGCELAWWTRGRDVEPVGPRVPYGGWRTAGSAETLFAE